MCLEFLILLTTKLRKIKTLENATSLYLHFILSFLVVLKWDFFQLVIADFFLLHELPYGWDLPYILSWGVKLLNKLLEFRDWHQNEMKQWKLYVEVSRSGHSSTIFLILLRNNKRKELIGFPCCLFLFLILCVSKLFEMESNKQ